MIQTIVSLTFAPMSPKTTKDRLLEAADELSAEFGFAGTSLRDLTQRAGVNLAAVNYHFGSKEGLFRELMIRRFAPINAERLARLDTLESIGEPNLEEVLEALVAPILALRVRDPQAARQLVEVIGRLSSAKGAHMQELIETFRQTSQRFMAALRRCLPQLPEREQLWRLNGTLGVMLGTMLDPHEFLQCSNNPDAEYQQQVLEDIVAFLAAGLRAPVRSREIES